MNGLESLVPSADLDEDYVLTYFDTLNELRVIDMAVLRIFNIKGDAERRKTMFNELGLPKEQLNAIAEKLVRLGMMNYTFIRAINEIQYFIRYLQNETARNWEKKVFDEPSKPKPIRRELTPYGNSFIEFFKLKHQD